MNLRVMAIDRFS